MRKVFLDLDGTLVRFNVERALERFDNEKGFFANLLAFDNIEIVNELAKNNNLFIISASPNERCDNDKMKWLDKFLPSLPKANIVFCRIGENKAEIIKNKIGVDIKGTMLLDDYTKNLTQWESAGGVGIKRLTSVADNSRGLWKGLTLTNLVELESLAV